MTRPKKSSASVGDIEGVQWSEQNALLGLQNVCGVAVANKWTGGEETEEPCLAVLVEQKLDADALGPGDSIPRTFGNVKTDVFETGPLFAGTDVQGPAAAPATDIATQDTATTQLLRTRIRPAKGGYSVGHVNITAGTYGTAVYDKSAFRGIPNRFYILSNNHVLADSNNARIGDAILQPGPYDGGTFPRDVIARLSRFIPIKFTPGSINYVDAAIAEGPFHQLDREIFWIGYVRGIRPASIGMTVQKTGRTTNYTTGRVVATNATVNVNYGGGRVARFARQILTTNMSAGGDSGSLVLDTQEKAVGLLFAGSSQVTILNDIRFVQKLLKIQIA